MVSNASDDLPEPESPVNTINCSRGSTRSTLRRLCSRAPRIRIVLLDVSATGRILPGRPADRTDVRLPAALQADDVGEAVGPGRGRAVRGLGARPVAREPECERRGREQPDAPGWSRSPGPERRRIVDARGGDPPGVPPLLHPDPVGRERGVPRG